MENFLSFCLRSFQVSIQLVSLTWQGVFNLANQYRMPQNTSQAATIQLNRRMYLHCKINYLTVEETKWIGGYLPPLRITVCLKYSKGIFFLFEISLTKVWELVVEGRSERNKVVNLFVEFRAVIFFRIYWSQVRRH